jgi:peptide chain release factor subunit 1
VDHSIEVFRLKKLFHRLETAKITGSVVTIILPPRKNIADITKLLLDEMGKASQIKDKRNANAVVEAQGSARERLKLYQRAPDNGLVVFTGRIMDENSTGEKKLICDFEPFKPVNLSVYNCDSKFYLDDLKKELLINEPPFGFIIVDGNGALYATLQGNAREILNKFTVELPKKHHKGGQSSVRFARLREEKRHNYLRKVCEVAAQTFITDNQCNVSGLVLAGSADFKNDLNKTDMFDPRLQTKVVNIVDVSYGFENGLNQAIEKSAEALLNIKFMKEKALISGFFEHIAIGDGMVIYGVQDTMKLIESGAVGRIICYEDLDYIRIKLKNTENQNFSTVFVKPNQATNPELYKDKDSGAVLEPVDEPNEPSSLPEWLAIHYKDYGCDIEFVTDKSPEGTQFLKGFAGLGGFLRYKVEVDHLLNEAAEYEEEDDDFI